MFTLKKTEQQVYKQDIAWADRKHNHVYKKYVENYLWDLNVFNISWKQSTLLVKYLY